MCPIKTSLNISRRMQAYPYPWIERKEERDEGKEDMKVQSSRELKEVSFRYQRKNVYVASIASYLCKWLATQTERNKQA